MIVYTIYIYGLYMIVYTIDIYIYIYGLYMIVSHWAGLS